MNTQSQAQLQSLGGPHSKIVSLLLLSLWGRCDSAADTLLICVILNPAERVWAELTLSGHLFADSYEARRDLCLLDTPLRQIRDFTLSICCLFFSVIHLHVPCETAENISAYDSSNYTIDAKHKVSAAVPTDIRSHFLGLQMFLNFWFDFVQRFTVLASSICSLFATKERHGTQIASTGQRCFPSKEPNVLIWYVSKTSQSAHKPEMVDNPVTPSASAASILLCWSEATSERCIGAPLQVLCLRCASNASGEPWNHCSFCLTNGSSICSDWKFVLEF